jgi:hypothetical protein
MWRLLTFFYLKIWWLLHIFLKTPFVHLATDFLLWTQFAQKQKKKGHCWSRFALTWNNLLPLALSTHHNWEYQTCQAPVSANLQLVWLVPLGRVWTHCPTRWIWIFNFQWKKLLKIQSFLHLGSKTYEITSRKSSSTFS